MLPIRREVDIPLAIIYVKTDRNLARRGSEKSKINVTGKNIFINGDTNFTYNLPGARVYPLPVDGEVHMVNLRVAFICWISVGGEVNNIAGSRTCGTNPRAPGFYMHRKDGTYHICDNTSSKNEN